MVKNMKEFILGSFIVVSLNEKKKQISTKWILAGSAQVRYDAISLHRDSYDDFVVYTVRNTQWIISEGKYVRSWSDFDIYYECFGAFTQTTVWESWLNLRLKFMWFFFYFLFIHSVTTFLSFSHLNFIVKRWIYFARLLSAKLNFEFTLHAHDSKLCNNNKMEEGNKTVAHFIAPHKLRANFMASSRTRSDVGNY